MLRILVLFDFPAFELQMFLVLASDEFFFVLDVKMQQPHNSLQFSECKFFQRSIFKPLRLE